MNGFDAYIMSFFNEFSRLSWSFDYAVYFTSRNHLLKCGVLTAMLWWGWFRHEEGSMKTRERILLTIVSSMAAILFVRVLALSLPFRVRPLHNPDLDFLLPYTVTQTTLEGWSSFPSDHAAMFFALATGLVFVSHSVGVFALVYTSLVICLPRIYLGLHYPSDIICGALIGVGIAWLANTVSLCVYVARPAMRWLNTKPGLFYASFFLVTYQIADLFNGTRQFGNFTLSILKGIAKSLH